MAQKEKWQSEKKEFAEYAKQLLEKSKKAEEDEAERFKKLYALRLKDDKQNLERFRNEVKEQKDKVVKER